MFPDPSNSPAWSTKSLDKIAALPGVAVSRLCGRAFRWRGRGMADGYEVEGQTPAAGPAAATRIKFVSPGYFEAMGTRMIAGREVTWSDIETGGRVVVVSEDFARELATEPAGALG